VVVGFIDTNWKVATSVPGPFTVMVVEAEEGPLTVMQDDPERHCTAHPPKE
jgi:hypothetical protein